MKWVTFTCLFLLSSSASEPLAEKTGSEHLFDTLYPLQDVIEIVHAVYYQLIPTATHEEIAKIAHVVTELAKKCSTDKLSDPGCTKPLETILYDQCCHEEGLPEKYGFTDCCAKVDPERNECFLSHKNARKDLLPPFQESSVEEQCKAFQEDGHAALDLYTYESGRRSTTTSLFFFLIFIHNHGEALKICCQEADKEACYNEKKSAFREILEQATHAEKHICSIQKTFGKRVVVAFKFAQLSQKFPKASADAIKKIALDIAESQEHCCKGDILKCHLERGKLISHICSHQDEISSKIKACCGKSILEQPTCVQTAINDDIPADLSLPLRKFVEHELLCPRYADDRNPLVEEFIYEQGRRHPEYSPIQLLRYSEEFEDRLEKCCKADNPTECLVQVEQHLKDHATNTFNVAKKNCDFYEKVGDSTFQNHLLFHYTRKLPQLDCEQLSHLVKTVSAGTAKCCKLDDVHLLSCIEKTGDLAVGDVCQQHKEHPINNQIGKCCDDYIKRLPSFESLGIDADYVAVPFNPELFTLHADICSVKVEDILNKKQRLLCTLVKHKPTITSEQLTATYFDTTGVVTKCCEADNREECFKTENPKLIEKFQAALESK